MAKIENIRELYGFEHGLGEFVVKQGRRMLYGLINAAGEIVLHPQPKRLLILDERQVMLWRSKRIKGDKNIVLNLETRESYSVERYDAENYGSTVIWKRGKGYGTVDVDGNTIILPQYRRLYRIDGEHFVARNRKNKYGILDKAGNEKCVFVYDQILDYTYNVPFLPDRFIVRQGSEWFVIDIEGRQLTQRLVTMSGVFYLEPVTPRGYAIFRELRHESLFGGVLDVTRDEVVIPAGYTGLRWLDNYRGGWTRVVALKDDFGLRREEVLTLDGKHALPQVYGGILDYYDGNYIVKSCVGGTYPDMSFFGVIDENGDTILPFEFSRIGRRRDIYLVRTKHYGLCSLTGETILPCEYSNIHIGDTLDYFAVCKNGEWYYVNQLGERVLL